MTAETARLNAAACPGAGQDAAASPAAAGHAAGPHGLAVRDAAEDFTGWDAYVDAHPESTFFHRSGWSHVFARTFGYRTIALAAERDGHVVGILPLLHVKTLLFGSALISQGFTVYGGILADDEDVRDALAADAARRGEALGVDFVELRHERPVLPGWTTKADLYATFKTTLAADEDENLKQIPRKKRADVRKGIKSTALRVDADAPLEAFYDCYATSLRNLGTPVQSRAYYRAIKHAFGDACEIATVNGPDGPVCGLMSFYFKDQVLPYFGGAKPEARALHAYDFMYWSLMRRAVGRGACVFDFGRSKVGTGAYDYKTYWGFEPKPLHYQYHLVKADRVPDVNPLNPKYRLMVSTWQKLPVWATNMIGPFVARQLG